MAFRLIETELGWFGLAWSAAGIRRAYLPGLTPEGLRGRLEPFGLEAADGPHFIEQAAQLIVAYGRGEHVSFTGLPLDLDGVNAFNRRAYDDIRALGWGETTTYGEVARRMGDVSLSRAVGQAMGSNPIPLIIPCHRVLGGGGKTGGFSAPGGAVAKVRMLALEGVDPGAHPGQMTFGF
jgi:methylated-DNA-[protein]-cysteine S-methyltransferase